jgi:hypothetical protein
LATSIDFSLVERSRVRDVCFESIPATEFITRRVAAFGQERT